MRNVIIALSLILCAPAFAGPVAKPSEMEKANCKKMADYGKGIASLKETGVTIDQFASYITEPKVQTFPIRTVSKYVYDLNVSPDQVYQQLFDNCIITGYSKQLAYFQREQEIIDLQQTNNDLTVKNLELERKVQELQTTLTSLQTKKPVRKPQ